MKSAKREYNKSGAAARAKGTIVNPNAIISDQSNLAKAKKKRHRFKMKVPKYTIIIVIIK